VGSVNANEIASHTLLYNGAEFSTAECMRVVALAKINLSDSYWERGWEVREESFVLKRLAELEVGCPMVANLLLFC